MPRRTFTQALKRLEELAQQDKLTHFEMGDVALDQIPMSSPDAGNGKVTAMAEAAGLTTSALLERRFVASRVPLTARAAGVSWSVYWEVATESDDDARRQLLDMVAQPNPATESRRWTVSTIRVHMGKKAITHTNSEPLAARLAFASDDEKIEAATALLNDMAVAETAMDTGTRLGQRAYDLREEHDRRVLEATRKMVEDTEQRDQGDPVVQKLEELRAINELTGVYADAATKATALLLKIHDFPKRDDDPLASQVFLSDATKRLMAVIDATDDMIAGRKQGLGDSWADAFFAQVLKEAKG